MGRYHKHHNNKSKYKKSPKKLQLYIHKVPPQQELPVPVPSKQRCLKCYQKLDSTATLVELMKKTCHQCSTKEAIERRDTKKISARRKQEEKLAAEKRIVMEAERAKKAAEEVRIANEKKATKKAERTRLEAELHSKREAKMARLKAFKETKHKAENRARENSREIAKWTEKMRRFDKESAKYHSKRLFNYHWKTTKRVLINLTVPLTEYCSSIDIDNFFDQEASELDIEFARERLTSDIEESFEELLSECSYTYKRYSETENHSFFNFYISSRVGDSDDVYSKHRIGNGERCRRELLMRVLPNRTVSMTYYHELHQNVGICELTDPC